MPELPEVETVRRSLVKHVVGKTFADVFVHRAKLIKNFDPSVLKGLKIKDVLRHGKYLIFVLSNGQVMLSHLRMEGKYSFPSKEVAKQKHDHVFFTMTDGSVFVYSDTRVFGTFHLYDQDKYLQSKEILKVGIDPLNEAFTGKYLHDRLSKKKIAVKTALLDQTIGSGIGNIYADEILWAVKIHPELPANLVKLAQANRMASAARDILTQAIAMNGTTIRTYHTAAGRGNFADMLQAHSRVNKPCSRCKTPIKKIKVNGRGTYFCPTCQKLP